MNAIFRRHESSVHNIYVPHFENPGSWPQVLITKARTEAEESLRQLLFALNGLAALFLLERQPVKAVMSYREVTAMTRA